MVMHQGCPSRMLRGNVRGAYQRASGRAGGSGASAWGLWTQEAAIGSSPSGNRARGARPSFWHAVSWTAHAFLSGSENRKARPYLRGQKGVWSAQFCSADEGISSATGVEATASKYARFEPLRTVGNAFGAPRFPWAKERSL